MSEWEEKRGEISAASWEGSEGPGVEIGMQHQDSLLLYRRDVDDLIELLRVVRERLP